MFWWSTGALWTQAWKRKGQEKVAKLQWYCDTSFCSGAHDSSPTVLEICVAEIATNLSFLPLPPFIFPVLAENKAYSHHSLVLRSNLGQSTLSQISGGALLSFALRVIWFPFTGIRSRFHNWSNALTSLWRRSGRPYVQKEQMPVSPDQ